MRPAHLNTRYKNDLTPRQREVMELITRGLTNAEIADRLGITLDGAKYHVREILGKLGVESREQAVTAWALMDASPRTRWSVFATVTALRFVVPVGLGLLIVSAFLLMMIVSDRSDDARQQPQALHSTPTTVPSTATRSPDLLLLPCEPNALKPEIDHEPSGDSIQIAVYVSSEEACRLVADARLGTVRPPVDPGPNYPAELNLTRRLDVDIAVDGRTPLGEWTWVNWCPEPMPWVGWRLDLLVSTEEGPISVPLNEFPGIFPACATSGAPTELLSSRLAPGVSDGAAIDAACDTHVTVAGCEFAHSVLNEGRQRGGGGIFQRWQSFEFYVQCDGNGGAIDYPGATLCEGAGNDFLPAGWSGTHPGEVRVVGIADLEAEISQRLQPHTSLRLVEVVCLTAISGSCGHFGVVLQAQDGSQTMLQFALESGREPGLRAHFQLGPGWDAVGLPVVP